MKKVVNLKAYRKQKARQGKVQEMKRLSTGSWVAIVLGVAVLVVFAWFMMGGGT